SVRRPSSRSARRARRPVVPASRTWHDPDFQGRRLALNGNMDQLKASRGRALWYALPCVLCLLLYWRGFTAWFRADDFAWLGAGIYINNFHDLLIALFAPQAQGTIRPLSERAFFMVGFSLFGLDALPFKIAIFATQFASLVLVTSIGARLTGALAAGVCAAVLWVINGSAIEPLGWTC